MPQLFKTIHISWLIGWSCLGLIIGTGLSAILPPSLLASSVWLWLAGCLLLVCAAGRRAWMIGLVFAAGCLVGARQGSAELLKLENYRPFYGQEVILQGCVTTDTSYGEKGDQRINLSSIDINGQTLEGDVWVSAAKADVKRGDQLKIKGTLLEGFGNTSATIYRADILEIRRPYPGDVARRVRDWFGAGVRKAIPEPQASLGLGYLVGQKTALPPDLEEQIKIVGLTHVVVASGYNLTILVVFARRLFSKISKYSAALLSSLLVASFMLVTGLSPSMTRAGLVAGIGLLVWYYGRKMHPFVLLSFAAALTVVINPSYVWGDLGWYLSFTAFIGVIVLAPLLQSYFWGSSQNIPMFRQLLIDTSAAQIVTSPIILLAFGQYPVYALPANMLVLPLVPLAMLCTFLAGIGGLAAPFAAGIIGLPATLILKYSTSVIAWTSNLPHAQGELAFNPLLMIASYICMAIAILYMKGRTSHDFRAANNPEKY